MSHMRAVILRKSEDGYKASYETDAPIPQLPTYDANSSSQFNEPSALVRVSYASLNRRDYWITQGLYPRLKVGSLLGSDCSGVVVDCNTADSQQQWKGKTVVVNAGLRWGNNQRAQARQFNVLGHHPDGGTLADYLVVPVSQLYSIPDCLSMAEASALPVAAVTAYRACFTQAQITRNDTVLISGIGGGVSTYAAAFSKAAGATVIVTTSSPHKIAEAKQRLGVDQGFIYTDKKCWKDIQLWLVAHKKTLNAVIDGSGGSAFNQYISLLDQGGRIAIYGATASTGTTEKINLHQLFLKQVSIHGTTMASSNEFADMLQFIAKHRIKPLIDSVFELGQIDEALLKLRDSSQIGKIVIRVNDHSEESVSPRESLVNNSAQEVIVVGAGVVGLTSALTLSANRQYKVTLIAETLPSASSTGTASSASSLDITSDSNYCSSKAGAHWFSFASRDDVKQQEFDRITFQKLHHIASTLPYERTGVRLVTGHALYAEKPADFVEPWWASLVPSFHYDTQQELTKRNSTSNAQIKFAYTYTTAMIDMTKYLPYLLQEFVDSGGNVIQQRLQSMEDCIKLRPNAVAVINCSGLQAAQLHPHQLRANSTVYDRLAQMYAVRGQTVVVRCPAITDIVRTVTTAESSVPPTYILPRGDGTVVLGGTYVHRDNSTAIDERIAADILHRCTQLAPVLGDKSQMTVLQHSVGFRPYSTTGIILEAEHVKFASRHLLCITNVGHGGYGVQSSHGCAHRVQELLSQSQRRQQSVSSVKQSKL